MPLVSLEQDKRYRRDGDRYVETCVACGLDREGTAEKCRCGAAFAKPTSNFWKRKWEPTSLVPRMPNVCPHCDGKPDRVRSITLTLPTQRSEQTRMTLEFGTCRRVPPPFLIWLALLTATFFSVVFGFAALFGSYGALVPLGVSVGAAWLAWRSYSWLRFARFDHRSIRLRARRPSYARALADKNSGRVL